MVISLEDERLQIYLTRNYFFRLRLAKNINRNYLILKNFMPRLYQGLGKHLKIRNKISMYSGKIERAQRKRFPAGSLRFNNISLRFSSNGIPPQTSFDERSIYLRTKHL